MEGIHIRAFSPHRSGLPIAPEGYGLIAATFGLAVMLGWLGGHVAGIIGAALWVFVVSFFRDPERVIPTDTAAIVAPADGRIINLTRVQDGRFLNSEATLICIFMSPLNVHVNRVPVTGRVVDIRYNQGKYFRAYAEKASLDNEQNAVVMEDEHGRRLCFVQIAGFLARRIVCYLRPGMQVERGQRFGMIRFGSRVDVYLPPDAMPCVAVGTNVCAGSTVIARWP